MFVNLIKAGENSGTLGKTLDDLSKYLEREKSIRSRVRSALIYPILLAVGSFLVLILLTTFALPRLAQVFSGGGTEIPAFSKVVFGVGIFFGNYIWYILAFIIITVAFMWYLVTNNLVVRNMLQKIGFSIPVIGSVMKKIALQRFASTFSSLLRAGLPITDSLEITADAIGWGEAKRALLRISREGLTRGITIGDAFRREKVFPSIVTNLVAISEKAGHLEETLQTLSDFYEPEIDSSLKTLVSFLEPMLLLVIGFVIGIIALSIIVPIYQIITII